MIIRKVNVNSLFCMWRLLFFLNLKCMEFFIYYVWLFKIIKKKWMNIIIIEKKKVELNLLLNWKRNNKCIV